jgi:hypothetical protein
MAISPLTHEVFFFFFFKYLFSKNIEVYLKQAIDEKKKRKKQAIGGGPFSLNGLIDIGLILIQMGYDILRSKFGRQIWTGWIGLGPVPESKIGAV